MLGGFFLAFVFLRENNKSLAAVGFAVLQRALRIWPAYIVAMFFYDSLFLQMGSGVFWNHAEPDTKMCSSMWREILFVANLVDNGNEQCLGWGWYLQVDFQLFLACLALLFIYYRSKMASFLLALLLSIGSTIFVIVYTYRHKIKLFTDLSAFSDFGEFMPDVYMKPYGRCTPYFMGLVLGILFVEYRSMYLKT
jgi:peptidoglycan/LPS O-acetylase OafA/YrhL